MKIERTRIDGEPVRRFHLLAEVTFRDREAEPRDEYDHNYYEDRELRDMVTGWMRDALEDRDDSPAVRFTDVSPPHIREAHRELIRLVWQWIINANNGNGADSGDLISALERAGYPCPPELEES